MTDNNGSQFATRDIRTHDLVTGEELLIVYFPRVNAITINGYSVTRSDVFEDSLGRAVFHRTPSDKPFTVETDSLSELYW
jgi:hypothetical protein